MFPADRAIDGELIDLGLSARARTLLRQGESLRTPSSHSRGSQPGLGSRLIGQRQRNFQPDFVRREVLAKKRCPQVMAFAATTTSCSS